MRRIQVLLAFVLLLFAGFSCGTENPVEETVETPSVETSTTDALPGEAAPETPIPTDETLEPPVEIDPPPDPEKLAPGQGLSIGSQAPVFQLPDSNGKLHALADYVADKNVVLIFYRGGW